MEVAFHTQATRSLRDTIKDLAVDCDSISIAVAYLSAEGLDEIRPYFGGADVKVVCGVHGCISDLWALRNLVCSTDLRLKGHVFIGQSLFHSKLYVFKNAGEEVTLLVGSPNFTIGGLRTNEEIFVEIRGKDSVQPIREALDYFDKLWTQKSISVESYLSQHPEYEVKASTQESLTPKQERVLKTLTTIAQRGSSFTFRNNVIQTVYRHGRQTIPTKYNDMIDDLLSVELGHSVSFDIELPDGSVVDGKIRYGHSSWGFYYELGVRAHNNVSKLKKLISPDDILEYHVDILQRTARIGRVS